MTIPTPAAVGVVDAAGRPASSATCGLGDTGADRDTSVSEWAEAAAGAIGATPPMMMQSGCVGRSRTGSSCPCRAPHDLSQLGLLQWPWRAPIARFSGAVRQTYQAPHFLQGLGARSSRISSRLRFP